MSESALPTQLRGVTLPFAGNGRKLGYPTANIILPTKLKDGVYFGYADLDDYYNHRRALIFIGTPSSSTASDSGRRIEAHILDIPDEDYYGLPLKLDVQHHHRRSETFTSTEELKAAMYADEMAARAWFDAHK